MQLTGVENLSGQMMSNMEPSMKATLTQAFPPGEYRAQLIELFLAKLRAKVSARRSWKLAVPTYDKYFSDDELHQLMAFYETPLGKKTITVMPQLMTELMTNSQQLGQQLGRDSLTEVFDEHPDLKQAMEAGRESRTSRNSRAVTMICRMPRASCRIMYSASRRDFYLKDHSKVWQTIFRR